MSLRRPLHRLAFLLVGAVFLAAGLLKIADPGAFARAIAGYHLLPERAVPAVAVLLPWWEIVAGGCAVAGLWRKGTLAVLAAMSAVFLAAGVVALARGLSPECGCFGPLGLRLGTMSLFQDTALLILCGTLIWREDR